MKSRSFAEVGDEELVELWKGGDMDAFEELVRRHKGWVLARAYRMSGSYHDAEDWGQEVFVRAFRKIQQYGGKVAFRHWLSKLSTRVFLNALRKRKARRWLSVLPQEEIPEGVMEGGESEAVIVLREAMRRLSAKDHVLVTLLELEDRGVSEVAAELKMSEGSVKTRLHRARKVLEEVLMRMRR